MNESKLNHKRSFLVSLMFIMSMVALATSAIFTILLVHYRTNDLIDLEDSKLLTAAELNREILGPDYHDRIVNETSVSEEQFRRIVARNDDLCLRLNLQYLWSVLLVDNRFVFTSATHTDIRDPASPCAAFFETHRDPGAFAPAMSAGFKPSFSTFHNEWGEGRMVLIPRKDARARTYMMGASVQLSERNAMIRRTIMTSGGIGLAVISGAFLFAFVLARSFTVPIARLTEATGRLAAGDFDASLGQSGTRELDILAASIDKMRQDLKQYVSELRQSEEKYKRLVETTDTGYVIIDDHGCVLDANPEYARLTGHRDLEEIVGHPVLEWTAPNDRGRNAMEVQKCVEQGFVRNLEINYITPDGRIIPVEINATVLRSSGSFRILGLCRDITERKLAEEALRQANVVVENSPVVLFRWRATEGWPVAMVSRNVIQFGYTPQELLSGEVPFTALVHPQDMDRVAREVREYSAGGVTRFRQEYRIVTKDGGVRWVDDRTVVERNVDGQIAFYQGIVIDITERKRTEEKLAHSHDLMRYIIEHANSAVAVHDRDLRYIYVSQRYLDQYKVKERDIIGKHHYDVFPDLPQKWRDVHQRALAGEVSSADRDPYYRADGTIDWTRWECRPWYEADGMIGGIIVYTEVITERVLAEEALIRNEALLSKSQEIGHIGSWERDLVANRLTWSHEVYRIFGVLPGKFTPSVQAFFEAVHPDDREAVNAVYSESVREGRDIFEIEHRLVRGDNGEVRFVLEKCEHVKDAAGSIVRSVGMVQDITERKRAEAELRESEERYRSLVETTSDWIWEIDEEARYVYASEKVLDLLGYAPEEVIGRTPFDLMPGPEARRLESQFQEIAAKRLPFTALENTNLHKNGRPVILETNGVPLFGPKGEFRGYRGMDRDITERKRAEVALRDSEERFRLAMEASRDGLWDWNVTTDKVYYSPGYAAMLGYTPGEVPGHVNSWKDLIHPEDKGATLEANVDCIENRRDDFEVEFRMEARNGEWRWILGRGKAVARDRAGRAVRLVGTHTDITERKRAEIKLHEREQRLNFLLTGTPAVIYTCRPSGDYAATFVSENVQSLLGYPASAFVDDPAFWLNHIHPDDRERVLRGVERLFAGHVHVHEYRFLRQDGTYRWMHDELRRLHDASGRSTEIIGCWIDITERKMAEDALRASLDEKTTLLREVHHRVKNNLQIVSSLLNLQADQEKSQPALAALRDTQNRVRSMALLHEMLYRTENLSRINGATYIEGLCAHLFHALGADPNRVRLDCRAAAVELGIDQAVPCGLIVNELVSNAIEHAFPEGRSGLITVELRRDADDRLALTVADDGAGFAAGFDFSRTSTLGLQLVRVLANQLKGVLRLERGRGAVFQVTFPGR